MGGLFGSKVGTLQHVLYGGHRFSITQVSLLRKQGKYRVDDLIARFAHSFVFPIPDSRARGASGSKITSTMMQAQAAM